jgi:O-antigen/teichoic acid export membrane protein
MAAGALMGFNLGALLTAWLGANLLRVIAETRVPLCSSLFVPREMKNRDWLRQSLDLIGTLFPIGSALLLMTLLTRLGVILLGHLGSPEDVAIYGSAFTFSVASGFVASSITFASFPRLTRALECGEGKEVAAILNSKFRLITIVFGLGCTIGILFGPPVLLLLLGTKLALSGWVMVVLMPGLYISCINFGIKYTLNAMGYYWSDAVSVLFGMVIFLVVLLGTHVLPLAYTAALAWGLGELAIFLFRLAILRRHNRQKGVPVFLIATTLSLLAAGSGLRCGLFS